MNHTLLLCVSSQPALVCKSADEFDIEPPAACVPQFEAMSEEYEFHRIDATQSIREVFQALTTELEEVLANMKPVPREKAERQLSEAQAESKGSG